jgi:hypothetical protein
MPDNENEPAQLEEPGVQQLTYAWRQRAHLVLDAHHTAAGIFERRHYWLGIPSVALSTVVGTAVFASLQKSPHMSIQIIVGLASIAAAVFASLLTFLRYNERADKHRLAGVRYGTIMRQLEQALLIPPHSEDEAKLFFDHIRSQWDELNEQSPTMPTSIWAEITGKNKKKPDAQPEDRQVSSEAAPSASPEEPSS